MLICLADQRYIKPESSAAATNMVRQTVIFVLVLENSAKLFGKKTDYRNSHGPKKNPRHQKEPYSEHEWERKGNKLLVEGVEMALKNKNQAETRSL